MTTPQTVPSTPPALALPGRTLLLCCDPALVDAQLAGADLGLAQAGPLRDDVSTDEITPVAILSHYDERLGRFAHTGFQAGGRCPIGPQALRQGHFSVLVAGARYGKGSSREHSPAAEKLAGIRLVIARSFERIYRQNADNIGLFTATDFGLVERLQRGEALTVDELVAGRDALRGQVGDRHRFAHAAQRGTGLVNKAFAGQQPVLALGPLTTDSEKSEQKGFVNLLIGLFGAVCNPLARVLKTNWPMSEQYALDILTLVSLIHRKLDGSMKAVVSP